MDKRESEAREVLARALHQYDVDEHGLPDWDEKLPEAERELTHDYRRAQADVVLRIVRADLEAVRESAWRDGWAECKARLTKDEAFCLTEDVEEDAWLDSDTRSLDLSAITGAGEC